MRKKNNIIEINGKRYDANTGELLPHHGTELAVKTNAATKPPSKSAGTKIPVKHTSHPTAKRSKTHNISRSPAPAHTLMRHAVRKPAPSLKRRIKVTGHTDSFAAQPALGIVSPALLRRPDKARLRHAHHIAKSRLISRFSAGTTIISNRLTPTSSAPQPQPAATLPQPSTPPKPSKAALLFEQGLQRATSHLEPAPKISRRRFHRKRKVHAHTTR